MPRPATALIVDDESHARLYVRQLLKEVGVTATWEAADGTEALALFAQHQPELVLLDINLRTMTGLKVLEQIRQRDTEVPVIMLSSENAVKTVNEAARLGADAYILKHVPKAQALAALKDALEDADESDDVETGEDAEEE